MNSASERRAKPSLIAQPPNSVNRTPRACTAALAEAISSAELAAATSCFSRRAALLTPDGTVVEGRDRVRGVLAQLIGMRMAIGVEPVRGVGLGDRALLSERWQFRHPVGESGASRTQDTHSLSLLRRVEGAGWEIDFLAPWGFG